MRRGGGIAEAFVAVVAGDAQHLPIGHRARGQRKAPGRVLLAHRAGRDLKVSNDHRGLPPEGSWVPSDVNPGRHTLSCSAKAEHPVTNDDSMSPCCNRENAT